MTLQPLLAVIPARTVSDTQPGFHTAHFAGFPLIEWSIRFAAACPEIDHCAVVTDSKGVAALATGLGAETHLLAPSESSAWSMLQHACVESEQRSQKQFGSVVLLDPASPLRLPQDITEAVSTLEADPEAVGVVSVSEPEFNPFWVCVEESEGYMKMLASSGKTYTRRQDVPPIYRINSLLYLCRRNHLIQSQAPRHFARPHRTVILPEIRAAEMHTPESLQVGSLMLESGVVTLPWLSSTPAGSLRI